jgi:hypothetical protein
MRVMDLEVAPWTVNGKIQNDLAYIYAYYASHPSSPGPQWHLEIGKSLFLLLYVYYTV